MKGSLVLQFWFKLSKALSWEWRDGEATWKKFHTSPARGEMISSAIAFMLLLMTNGLQGRSEETLENFIRFFFMMQLVMSGDIRLKARAEGTGTDDEWVDLGTKAESVLAWDCWSLFVFQWSARKSRIRRSSLKRRRRRHQRLGLKEMKWPKSIIHVKSLKDFEQLIWSFWDFIQLLELCSLFFICTDIAQGLLGGAAELVPILILGDLNATENWALGIFTEKVHCLWRSTTPGRFDNHDHRPIRFQFERQPETTPSCQGYFGKAGSAPWNARSDSQIEKLSGLLVMVWNALPQVSGREMQIVQSTPLVSAQHCIRFILSYLFP